MLAIRPHRCYIGSREAASRVRSHISPGPYRSFRELSLAGSVDPDIWCPPTFVGNSGIERFNGVCGFALEFALEFFLRCCFPSSRCGGWIECRYQAPNGAPARCGLAVEHLRLWNTGSPVS